MLSGALGWIVFPFTLDNHLAVVLLLNSFAKILFWSNKWAVIYESIPLLSLLAMGNIQ